MLGSLSKSIVWVSCVLDQGKVRPITQYLFAQCPQSGNILAGKDVGSTEAWPGLTVNLTGRDVAACYVTTPHSGIFSPTALPTAFCLPRVPQISPERTLEKWSCRKDMGWNKQSINRGVISCWFHYIRGPPKELYWCDYKKTKGSITKEIKVKIQIFAQRCFCGEIEFVIGPNKTTSETNKCAFSENL